MTRQRITLGSILAPKDRDGMIVPATVEEIFADGTVSVSFGADRIVSPCRVLSWYTPASGDAVEVVRRDDASWLVLGQVRVSNPATVTVGQQWGFPYSITPASPGAANPLVVSATSTRTWREGTDGWSPVGLPAADSVAQGAATTAYGYYRGCYFYGSNVFTVLAGRRCTRLQIRLNRLSVGGFSASTSQVLAPHAHGSQPVDPPYFVNSAVDVGSLAWGANAVFDLPPAWGDQLISGVAKGVGHLLLAAGNGYYSLSAGKTADTLTGQLTLDWL